MVSSDSNQALLVYYGWSKYGSWCSNISILQNIQTKSFVGKSKHKYFSIFDLLSQWLIIFSSYQSHDDLIDNFAEKLDFSSKWMSRTIVICESKYAKLEHIN